jgi:hypothetical protein
MDGLKQMLWKVIEQDGNNWDQLLPYLMFSIREVPHASTGFSPFELLYGRNPRGILDLAKEVWANGKGTYGEGPVRPSLQSGYPAPRVP